MKQEKPTFNRTLAKIEGQNAENLMLKARLANRLAKKSCGTNRKTAYNVKANALCSLIKKLPNYVRVSKDIKLTDFIVVELKTELSGLHLPAANLVA